MKRHILTCALGLLPLGGVVPALLIGSHGADFAPRTAHAEPSPRNLLVTQAPEDFLDTTPPASYATIFPQPNAANWNNTDVTVTVAADDDYSGIRHVTWRLSGAQTGGDTIYGGTASFSVSNEGVTTVTYSAMDNADNSEPSRVLLIRIDRTPPSVSLTCPPMTTLRTAASASVHATDGLSGIAFESAGRGSALLDTSTVGRKTFTVTAQDNAGNVASNACPYQVVYDFSGPGGFKPPIVSPPGTNVIRAGMTAPVTWQIPDGLGGHVGDLGAVEGIALQEVGCSEMSGTADTQLPAYAGGDSVLRYDPASGHFVYNWRTDPSFRNRCYVLILRLDDGTEHRANFSVK